MKLAIRLSSLNKNIIANITSRGISFISTYLFTPLFLYFLGIESFGLVGFFSTLMGILMILDLGLTASLTRESARLSISKKSETELKNTIRTFELIYLLFSIVIAISVWILAPMITDDWLNIRGLDIKDVIFSIRIMGFVIAFQLPTTLYFGGLMGLNKQIKANTLQISWSLLRAIFTVLVLWLYSPTIIAFVVCQLISNLIYFLVIRKSIWKLIPFNSPLIIPKFDKQTLIKNWKYSLGIAGISLLSTIIIQSDKIVMSKLLSLEELGYYTLAATIAMFPIMISNPITSAVFPEFINLIESKSQKKNNFIIP